MAIQITKADNQLIGSLTIPASKSESNRALIIKSLTNSNFEIKNLSDSNDTLVLEKAINQIANNHSEIIEINIEDCGTAMRFLTSVLAITKGEFILTGSERMKQRPIQFLVDSLNKINANISYLENTGFPPLRITGSELIGDSISINGSVSSQYISSILMISPLLKNGLKINLEKNIVSEPYIYLTLKMMNHFGIQIQKTENCIVVPTQKYIAKDISINGDWSSVSYWYEMAAFSEDMDLKIHGISKTGFQGDEVIAEIFEAFGVKTTFHENYIHLTKTGNLVDNFEFDFSNHPDLALTVAVCCAGLKINCNLKGLKTLKDKESNRFAAIVSEIGKLGIPVKSNEIDEISFNAKEIIFEKNILVNTFNDHRIAMAFAPLACILKEIKIEESEIVKKSYSNFWEDLKNLGFKIGIIENKI
jgi:3-phosphoshikimate 1-carboxyvinyltransferase